MKIISSIAIAIGFLCSRTDAETSFVYLKNGDLIAYCNVTRSGLSLFPLSSGDGSNSRQADEDRRRLRKRILDGSVNAHQVHSDLKNLLESDNLLGFAHYCAAIARTGKEADVLNALPSLFSANPKRNFSVVHGALVICAFSPEAAKLKPEIKQFVRAAKRKKVTIEKTVRFPDIVAYFETNFSKAGDR